MNSRSIKNFFQVASLVLVLITVALLAAITTMHFAIHGAEVQVPVLKGLTVAEARVLTAGLGLSLNVDNRYYSGDVASGHILSQSPADGTVVRRGWRVRVAESLGPQKVEVPDTLGVDERVAELSLRRVALEVGAVAHLPYAGAAEGMVLAQDPPAHAQDIERPSINLLVAAPPTEAPDGFVMPDLTGLPLASAQAALFKVGIKPAQTSFVDEHVAPVGSGEAPARPPVKPGAITGQSPAAGSRVEQDARVKLVVAK